MQPTGKTKRKRPALPPNCYWRGDTIYFRTLHAGTEHRISLRTSDPEAAGREADRILARLKNQGNRKAFEDALLDWTMNATAHLSPRTADRYGTSFVVLRKFVGGLFLDEIDRAVIADFVKKRQQAGTSVATVRRDLTALSRLLEHGIDEGWCSENAAFLRLRKLKERRDPIFLPADRDIEAVLALCTDAVAAIARFALSTGMRQDEVVTLTWDDVDLRGRSITVVGKGRKRRTIPIRDEAAAILRGQPRGLRCPYVFWHFSRASPAAPDRHPVRYKNLAGNFTRIVARAKASAQEAAQPFRAFRFHDLRHRFAVDFLKKGGSFKDLQRELGHSSIKVTEIYTTFLTPDEERAAWQGQAEAGAEVGTGVGTV